MAVIRLTLLLDNGCGAKQLTPAEALHLRMERQTQAALANWLRAPHRARNDCFYLQKPERVLIVDSLTD